MSGELTRAVVANAVGTLLNLEQAPEVPLWVRALADAFYADENVKRCRVSGCPHVDDNQTTALSVSIDGRQRFVCVRCFALASMNARELFDRVRALRLPQSSEIDLILQQEAKRRRKN
jgi:hypothetical protein